MVSVLDSLPATLQRRLASLRIKHAATHGSDGTLRKGYTQPKDAQQAPGAYHPMVRVVPETGEVALYLGRRPNAYIEGMALSDSEVCSAARSR